MSQLLNVETILPERQWSEIEWNHLLTWKKGNWKPWTLLFETRMIIGSMHHEACMLQGSSKNGCFLRELKSNTTTFGDPVFRRSFAVSSARLKWEMHLLPQNCLRTEPEDVNYPWRRSEQWRAHTHAHFHHLWMVKRWRNENDLWTELH